MGFSMTQRTGSHQRSIRAALAVTMTVAGCSRVGIDPVSSPDAGDASVPLDTLSADTGTDGTADVGSDVVEPDSASPCSAAISDGICPPECAADDDIDCCEIDELCDYFDGRCGCAVEGPFAPPSTRIGVAT